MSHDRMEELEALIKAGWGDTAGDKIPRDWRTRKPTRAEVLEASEFWGEEHDPTAYFVMRNEAQRAREKAIRRSHERKDQPDVPLERKCAEMRERMRAGRKLA
jgi:hypothetical protein